MGREMQPIRDLETVNMISRTLEQRTDAYGRRLFALWYIGVNLGLRISDMLQLRVGDLRDKTIYYLEPRKQRHMREYWARKHAEENNTPIRELRPRETGYTLPPGLRRMMRDRYGDAPADQYIFTTVHPKRYRQMDGSVKPITRQEAAHDMKVIQRLCGVDMPMGCYTLRKTFGYQNYKQFHDIGFLLKWFQHSGENVTLRYIGVDTDQFRERMDKSRMDIYGK